MFLEISSAIHIGTMNLLFSAINVFTLVWNIDTSFFTSSIEQIQVLKHPFKLQFIIVLKRPHFRSKHKVTKYIT